MVEGSTNLAYLKFLGGHTMTITSKKLITAITFTCNELYGVGNFTATTGTFTDGAWASADGVISVTMTNSGEKMAQIKSITFTLADNPSLLADPTFTSTAYDDNTFIEPITVTISHDTATKIVYTTDGTVPSLTNGTVYTAPFTLSETATVKAIAYDNNDNSSSVVSTYYKSLTGIKSIRAAIAHGETTGAKTTTLTNAIVTYQNGSNFYIQDGTSPDDGAGIVLEVKGKVEVGNSITGTVTWSGYINRDGLTCLRTIITTNATVTANATIPDAVEVPVADLESDIEKYESYYIKVTGIKAVATTAAKSKTASTGEDKVVFYNATSSTMCLAAADETTYTGYAYNPSADEIRLTVFGQDNVSQSSAITFSDDYNYATRVENAAYTIPDDLEVSYISSCADGVLTQTSITGTVPASTPVLLKAAETGHTSTINFLNFDTTSPPPATCSMAPT